jgi:hypothetical protein
MLKKTLLLLHVIVDWLLLFKNQLLRFSKTINLCSKINSSNYSSVSVVCDHGKLLSIVFQPLGISLILNKYECFE